MIPAFSRVTLASRAVNCAWVGSIWMTPAGPYQTCRADNGRRSTSGHRLIPSAVARAGGQPRRLQLTGDIPYGLVAACGSRRAALQRVIGKIGDVAPERGLIERGLHRCRRERRHQDQPDERPSRESQNHECAQASRWSAAPACVAVAAVMRFMPIPFGWSGGKAHYPPVEQHPGGEAWAVSLSYWRFSRSSSSSPA